MTIDVDDLVAQISAGIYGDDRMTWDTIEAATTALSQLVTEVERLRGERAAVVAYLRERQPDWPAGSGGHADAIENGEHRREDER